MQCLSCRFENMPGLTACGRCGSVLDVRGAAIDVHPVRASRRAKRLRRWLPTRRYFQARDKTQELLDRTAGSIIQDLSIPLPEPQIAARLLVPGLAHIHAGLPIRGRIFMGVYLALLGFGLLFWGTQMGAIAIGFAFGLAVTFAFAGGLATPTLSVVLESAAWLALANGVVCVIAIGLASLTGSRPGTITALIGWELVLSPLLVQSTSLGSARNGLLDGVLLFLKPGPVSGAPVLTMSVAVAVAVTALWAAVLPALGARRMQTRDA